MSSSRRLSRWSIFFLLGSTLRGLLLPLVALLFTTAQSRWDMLFMWFSLPVAGVAVWRYFTTTYELIDDELVLHTGLLFRNVRHVRYARVHNVETIQNPFHRLVGVAEVRVETAGASEREARLSVLRKAEAEEFRRRVIEGKNRAPLSGAAAPAPETPAGGVAETTTAVADAGGDVLVRLGWRDLVAFGLTQNRGGIVIGACFGILWEADLLDMEVGRPTHAVWRFLEQTWGGGDILHDPLPAQIARVILVALAVLVLIRILSLGWAVVQLWGFTLSRHGSELRSTRGLLTRVHGTIPVARVQLVSIRRSPLMRLWGRVEVRVQTAGGDKHATPGREWLAPSLRNDAVDALVASVLPGVEVATLAWQPADARATWRMRREALLVIALGLVAGMVFFRIPALVMVGPAIVWAWIAADKHAGALGHVLLPEHVATRGGWLWQHTSIARYAKLQAVSLSQSPFDRRWTMADVFADTAGGGSHRIRIPCLPAGEADRVYGRLCTRAASTTFRW